MLPEDNNAVRVEKESDALSYCIIPEQARLEQSWQTFNQAVTRYNQHPMWSEEDGRHAFWFDAQDKRTAENIELCLQRRNQSAKAYCIDNTGLFKHVPHYNQPMQRPQFIAPSEPSPEVTTVAALPEASGPDMPALA